jgi:hypothetical protein
MGIYGPTQSKTTPASISEEASTVQLCVFSRSTTTLSCATADPNTFLLPNDGSHLTIDIGLRMDASRRVFWWVMIVQVFECQLTVW